MRRAAKVSQHFQGSKRLHTKARQVDTVVVGGGCVGLGVASALAKAGHTSVMLIEKEEHLCSETSAQAAGLVGQVQEDLNRIKQVMKSVAAFTEFQDMSTAQDCPSPNWREVGSLRIATNEKRLAQFDQFKKSASMAGLELNEISPGEAELQWPGLKLESKALSVLHCPTDGYLQPYDLAMTYHFHASNCGVQFSTGTKLVEIMLDSKRRVCGVKTSKGIIECENVINAAGAHAYHVCQLVGLTLPIIPVRHHYFITEPVSLFPVTPEYPVLRCVDQNLYARPEINSVLCGGFEDPALNCDPAAAYSIEEKPPFIEDDWECMDMFANNFGLLYPTVLETGVKKVMSGWPTFTPDGEFFIGPTRVHGFIMAGGCNAHGIMASIGIGHDVVRSSFTKKDEISAEESKYLETLSPERFLDGNDKSTVDWNDAQTAAKKIYSGYYGIPELFR